MTRIITFLVLFVSITLCAQRSYKTADKFFDQMRYVEAAAAYEKAFDKGDHSMELLQKAGDAYYYNTNMVEANKWYDLLIGDYRESVDPEYIFRYSHSLQGIGDYTNAKKWMKIFAKASKNTDARTEDYAQKDQTVNDILEIMPQFEVKNLNINTKYSDFGPAYYKNKLVYSSAVDTSYFIKKRYHWNDQPFLSFYTGTLNAAQNKVSFVTEFSKEINTQYHEATLVFTKDHKRIFFTRNNYNESLKRDKEGVNHLKLYTAVRSDSTSKKEDWINIKELPFNSDDYSVGHPALSEDGKKLYFVSDMPGTMGATDIFVVDILDDDEYSTPKNLGPAVNTSGREMFPFVRGSKLFFASDGHLGMGGLDVFVSNLASERYTTPRNLGQPINSKLDDFSFIIDADEEFGFIASNREGGMGDDDIYSFERIAVEEDVCTQIVKGYVTNARTQERIAAVTVSLYDGEGTKIEESRSQTNGDYAFKTPLNCQEPYEVRAEKTGYEPANKEFQTSAISQEMILPLNIETVDELIVEDQGLLKIKVGIIYFNLSKDYIRPDAAIELNKIVMLMAQQPTMKIRIESHTDARGKDAFNMDLSQRRAANTRAYLINQGVAQDRIVDAQGFGETQLLNSCSNGVSCDEAQHQLNRRSEFIIVKM